MNSNHRHDASDSPSGSLYGDLLAEVAAMGDDVLEKATIEAKSDMDRANARLLVLTNALDKRRGFGRFAG